jgi:hypothetical protein
VPKILTSLAEQYAAPSAGSVTSSLPSAVLIGAGSSSAEPSIDPPVSESSESDSEQRVPLDAAVGSRAVADTEPATGAAVKVAVASGAGTDPFNRGPLRNSRVPEVSASARLNAEQHFPDELTTSAPTAADSSASSVGAGAGSAWHSADLHWFSRDSAGSASGHDNLGRLFSHTGPLSLVFCLPASAGAGSGSLSSRSTSRVDPDLAGSLFPELLFGGAASPTTDDAQGWPTASISLTPMVEDSKLSTSEANLVDEGHTGLGESLLAVQRGLKRKRSGSAESEL